MMNLSSSLRRIFLLGLVLAGSACEDPLTPEEEVAGAYEATTLLVREGSVTFDALEAGADLEIILHPDGTTTGHIYVPGGDDDGGDFAADLAGSWSVQGDEVTFDHPADTFIRDMTMRMKEERLEGELGGVQLVLSRQ